MKANGLFKIGEMSKIFHISVSSLRHYESMGLLVPEYTDAQTGYRYYSTRQFETLDTIRYLRKLGLPLSEISSFVNNRSLADIKRLLELQLVQVRRQLSELGAVEKQIENRLSQIDRGPDQSLDTVMEQPLPARRLAVLDRRLEPEDDTALALAIRELAGEDKRALVFLGKIGVGVSAESLRRRTARPCDFLFLVLEENEEHSGKVLRVPESRGLSLRFIGGHDKAGENYKRLFDYMDERGLSPDGPALEITMIDQGFTSNASEFLTEIQVPLKPY